MKGQWHILSDFIGKRKREEIYELCRIPTTPMNILWGLYQRPPLWLSGPPFGCSDPPLD